MQTINKSTISILSNSKNIGNNQKKIKIIFSVLILSIIALIVAKPNLCIGSIYSGLSVWAKCVLPSLLPFMFFTKLLTNLNFISTITTKTYRLNKFLFKAPKISSYIFLMSIISGYPVGAKIICEYHKNGLISTKQANKLSTFCNTSGPLFVIGSVGTVLFGSAKLGYIIFLSHILSSVLNGILYRNLFVDETNYFDGWKNDDEPIDKNLKDNKNCSNKKHFETKKENMLAESMKDTILSVLLVGGWIAISFLIIDLFLDLKLFEPLVYIFSKTFAFAGIKAESIKAVLCGILEVSKGVLELSKLPISKIVLCCCASFLIGFGGISVFMQANTFLKDAKVNSKFYLLSKLTHGIIGAILSFLLCLIFKI